MPLPFPFDDPELADVLGRVWVDLDHTAFAHGIPDALSPRQQRRALIQQYGDRDRLLAMARQARVADRPEVWLDPRPPSYA